GNPVCGPDSDPATMFIPEIFTVLIGNTPYMGINNTYTNGNGQPASSSPVYAGSIVDNSYSHGNELSKTDIEDIITSHLDLARQADRPAAPQGIYVVIATADIASNQTGFCTPGAPPFHSYAYIFSMPTPYIFLGGPNRCKTIAGGQYFTTNA